MDWDPEDYARHSGAQLAWARELIARLDLAPDEAVLDVGCGDGKITAEFARALPVCQLCPPMIYVGTAELANGFVLGVDSSPAFVDYARQHYPPSTYPNLCFEIMDARRLAYPRRFDLIFSNAALHWVDDHQAFLAGCARLLAPGGRLVLSCGGKGNAAAMVSVMDELIRKPHWERYFAAFAFPYHFYATADYDRWLPEAGLRPIRLELVEKDMAQQGREGLAGWIRTTWMPYTHCLPEEHREAFILEAVDDYLRERPLDELGRSHVHMVRLEVEASILPTLPPHDGSREQSWQKG
jgi:trans-aconitate 2-methyltransferase